jgi:hypothetical protein
MALAAFGFQAVVWSEVFADPAAAMETAFIVCEGGACEGDQGYFTGSCAFDSCTEFYGVAPGCKVVGGRCPGRWACMMPLAYGSYVQEWHDTDPEQEARESCEDGGGTYTVLEGARR